MNCLNLGARLTLGEKLHRKSVYIYVIISLHMDEKKTHYKTVQLPIEALAMLDKIIEAQPEFAYRSHAELVMDLIRRRYEEIRKY